MFFEKNRREIFVSKNLIRSGRHYWEGQNLFVSKFSSQIKNLLKFINRYSLFLTININLSAHNFLSKVLMWKYDDPNCAKFKFGKMPVILFSIKPTIFRSMTICVKKLFLVRNNLINFPIIRPSSWCFVLSARRDTIFLLWW